MAVWQHWWTQHPPVVNRSPTWQLPTASLPPTPIIFIADFSGDRSNAIDQQDTARELVNNVTGFAFPGQVFKTKVSEAESKRAILESKLADLKGRSQKAGEQVS